MGTEKAPQKKLCDEDFAERSGELSGAICLKTPVLLDNDRQPPRIVKNILLCCSHECLVLLLLAPDKNYVKVPEMNPPEGPKSPEITVWKSLKSPVRIMAPKNRGGIIIPGQSEIEFL